ncbi:MAG: YdcF family protein, partial [Sulfurimonas sp.]|nr:YdcF family protein [Sulfurimonas sp.]
FTGYAGKTDISNAKMNAKLAMALGVDKKNIIVNPNPKDTKEEALFTKTIVGDEPFILVTSATHMPRAMMLFKSLGLNPIPAPTNFYKEEFKGYFKLPDINNFNKSQVAMHEYIGILWARLKGLI